jgi:hypothetical protein
MEQAHQPATNNHINRYERLGTCRSIIPGVGITQPPSIEVGLGKGPAK